MGKLEAPLEVAYTNAFLLRLHGVGIILHPARSTIVQAVPLRTNPSLRPTLEGLPPLEQQDRGRSSRGQWCPKRRPLLLLLVVPLLLLLLLLLPLLLGHP